MCRAAACLPLLLVLLVLAVQQGAAIKCFECNSRVNEACDDPWPNTPLLSSSSLLSECHPLKTFTNASLRFDLMPKSLAKMFLDIRALDSFKSGATVPHKIVCLKAKIRSAGQTVVMRHCVDSHPVVDSKGTKSFGICHRIKKALGNKVEFCGVCGVDGCNSAPTRSPGASLLLLAPLLALITKFV